MISFTASNASVQRVEAKPASARTFDARLSPTERHVIDVLRRREPLFVSAESLSAALGVSTPSIYTLMTRIRAKGISIESSKLGSGFRLPRFS